MPWKRVSPLPGSRLYKRSRANSRCPPKSTGTSTSTALAKLERFPPPSRPYRAPSPPKLMRQLSYEQSAEETQTASQESTTIVSEYDAQSGKTRSEIQKQKTKMTLSTSQKFVQSFSIESVIPAFTSFATSNNSNMIRMFNNRFDVVNHQTRLMYYCEKNEQIGPGYYVANCPIRMKLDYPIFRGLNTFRQDAIQRSGIYYPRVQPLLLMQDLPLLEVIRDVERMFERFFEQKVDWNCTVCPITPEELIRMTVCRYAARSRGLSMSLIDEEEETKLFPIRSLTFDSENNLNLGQRFGIQQTVADRKLPLNQVSFLNFDVSKKSASQFVVLISYDVRPFRYNMYRYDHEAMLQYTEIRSLQRSGLSCHIEMKRFCDRFGGGGSSSSGSGRFNKKGKTEEEEASTSSDDTSEDMVNDSSSSSTTEKVHVKKEHDVLVEDECLEKCLMSRGDDVGSCSSSEMYDVETIGIVQQYIQWCQEKYEWRKAGSRGPKPQLHSIRNQLRPFADQFSQSLLEVENVRNTKYDVDYRIQSLRSIQDGRLKKED